MIFLKFIRENKFTFLFLAVLILGGFLRFYKLGTNSFAADEFLDVNSSFGYSQTGKWQAWDFNFGKVAEEKQFAPRDERAWMYKWQVAQLFKFLPPTEGVARSVSALWGIAAMLIVAYVAYDFTKNKKIALFAAFLTAISVDEIVFSRMFRMYAMFFPVYLLFVWLFYRFYEGRYEGKLKFMRSAFESWKIDLRFLIPAAAAGLLSLHLHSLTLNFIAVFLVYSLIQAVRLVAHKSYWNKYTVSLLAAAAGYLAITALAPQIINEASAGLRPISNLAFSSSYFLKVISDYSHPLLALLFIILGIVYFVKEKREPKEALWFAASFFVPLLMAVVFWNRAAGQQYIFFIQSFEIIFIAAGIYYVAHFLKKNMAGLGSKAYYVPVAVMMLILPSYTYFFTENNTYHESSESEHPDYRRIFGYVKKRRGPNDVLVTRNFRNYYWGGEKMKVYDFGGELAKEKLSPAEMERIKRENPSGWVVIPENDEIYVTKAALEYMDKNLTRVDDFQVRGNMRVYRW